MNFRDQVFIGDVLEKLREIPDGIVQCCVTSPPYYGLRDYETRSWFGGDPSCQHDLNIEHGPHHPNQVEQTKWKDAEAAGKGQTAITNSCSKCGAWYGQIGLEPTSEMYVEHLVTVFREVRRVLRDDGTLWLNLGDSYASTPTGNMGTKSGLHGAYTSEIYTKTIREQYTKYTRPLIPKNLKQKDLIGIPWMAAFALRSDGWWLRSDIIWSKPNPMPESVTDRPTKSHEYVFLLTKNQDYFYDQEAIKEPSIGGHSSGVKERAENHQEGRSGFGTRVPWDDLGQGRNKRSVWTINTKPYKGAHFAVMPEELASLCIKAGSSEKGCCPKCGAPWIRTVEYKKWDYEEPKINERDGGITSAQGIDRTGLSHFKYDKWRKENPPITTDWKPSCQCNATDSVPCLILDPFAGSGTTLSVAAQLGRSFVGIEINPEYGKLIEERVRPAIEYRSQREIFEMMMDLPSESE
jgi:DNA modification methylase